MRSTSGSRTGACRGRGRTERDRHGSLNASSPMRRTPGGNRRVPPCYQKNCCQADHQSSARETILRESMTLDAGLARGTRREALVAVELDDDLAGTARVVRGTAPGRRARVRAPSSISSRARSGAHLPRAEAAEPALDGDRRQPGPEQLARLAARRLVAGDEQHGAAPGAAERRVDARLADERRR